MCIRFHSEDNKPIIPQTFPDSLREFAIDGAWDASWHLSTLCMDDNVDVFN